MRLEAEENTGTDNACLKATGFIFFLGLCPKEIIELLYIALQGAGANFVYIDIIMCAPRGIILVRLKENRIVLKGPILRWVLLQWT